MGLDIRTPIGMLFATLGILLVLYGLLSDSVIYGRSLGININLLWGAVMLVFGLVMFYMGRRGSRPAAMRPAETTPEGRATEEREHRLHLER